ncbi:MAG: hypothetical protein HUU22_05130 [Phycisphaerae bacterium]|nr:hypothetical protein [Phycisphaerae bacterium]NUQ45396.1 hypothetical protein [Phycisphaerae bacterium]
MVFWRLGIVAFQAWNELVTNIIPITDILFWDPIDVLLSYFLSFGLPF